MTATLENFLMVQNMISGHAEEVAGLRRSRSKVSTDFVTKVAASSTNLTTLAIDFSRDFGPSAPEVAKDLVASQHRLAALYGEIREIWNEQQVPLSSVVSRFNAEAQAMQAAIDVMLERPPFVSPLQAARAALRVPVDQLPLDQVPFELTG